MANGHGEVDFLLAQVSASELTIWLGLAWPVVALPGLAWLCLAWLGLAWPGLKRDVLPAQLLRHIGIRCLVLKHRVETGVRQRMG